MAVKQWIFLSTCLIWLVSVTSQIVYKTTNIECYPNLKYAQNSSCVVKARNWNLAVAEMDTDFIRPLRNFSVRLEVFKKGYNNRYHPFLVNALFNMCDLLAKRKYPSYGKILLNLLKRYSNLNHSCPITGRLSGRNFKIDVSDIPNLPLGFYRCSISCFENFAKGPPESAGQVHFYWEVMEMVKPKKNKISK